MPDAKRDEIEVGDVVVLLTLGRTESGRYAALVKEEDVAFFRKCETVEEVRKPPRHPECKTHGHWNAQTESGCPRCVAELREAIKHSLHVAADGTLAGTLPCGHDVKRVGQDLHDVWCNDCQNKEPHP